MKKFLVWTFALAMVGTYTHHAQAGFLIEPYLGYETGDSENSGSTNDFSGVSFGARLGFSFTMVSVGVDYMKGTGTIDTATETDTDTTDLGAFILVDFPIALRAYAVYLIDSQLDATQSGTTTDFEGSGGTKIGLGFTFLPLVSINIDAISRTYDKANGNNLTNDAKMDTYMLSVSLPLP